MNQDKIAAGELDIEVNFNMKWRHGARVKEHVRRAHPFPNGGKIISLGHEPLRGREG